MALHSPGCYLIDNHELTVLQWHFAEPCIHVMVTSDKTRRWSFILED